MVLLLFPREKEGVPPAGTNSDGKFTGEEVDEDSFGLFNIFAGSNLNVGYTKGDDNDDDDDDEEENEIDGVGKADTDAGADATTGISAFLAFFPEFSPEIKAPDDVIPPFEALLLTPLLTTPLHILTDSAGINAGMSSKSSSLSPELLIALSLLTIQQY